MKKTVSCIVVVFLLLVGCKNLEKTVAPSVKNNTMKTAIYVEETFKVGTDTYVSSISPMERYGVVFEDDTETGYFYALDFDKKSMPIVESLHIYNVDNVIDKDIPSILHIVWSSDGMKSMLLLTFTKVG